MDIERFRNDALAFYHSLPDKKKGLAKDFFKELDKDKDGTVSLIEFLEFLRETGIYRGYDQVSTFRMFDRDGNGILDFCEVITLLYYLALGPGAQHTSAVQTYVSQGKWKKAYAIFLRCAEGIIINEFAQMAADGQLAGIAAAANCSMM